MNEGPWWSSNEFMARRFLTLLLHTCCCFGKKLVCQSRLCNIPHTQHLPYHPAPSTVIFSPIDDRLRHHAGKHCTSLLLYTHQFMLNRSAPPTRIRRKTSSLLFSASYIHKT